MKLMSSFSVKALRTSYQWTRFKDDLGPMLCNFRRLHAIRFGHIEIRSTSIGRQSIHHLPLCRNNSIWRSTQNGHSTKHTRHKTYAGISRKLSKVRALLSCIYFVLPFKWKIVTGKTVSTAFRSTQNYKSNGMAGWRGCQRNTKQVSSISI